MEKTSADADANSTIRSHFELAADGLEPALRWAAGSPAEHAEWRRAFSGRLQRLVGKRPRRVPLEVRWDEVADLGTVVRRKVYVRSEAHYWVPAYYFVPKQVREKTPAILCLHGHSGILPYIREGDDAQRRSAGRGTWTTPSTWPSTATSRWRRCSAAGTRPRCPRTRPRAPTVATASPWTPSCSA